ncbi:hypothetical protein [Ehrlichia japonica]|uniref:Immunodominant surface domain protein n=1 Tax=Ehrlichia japonica TaxID=391036 RepID=X5GIX0_9RICK|nr:hypothetical protein [Ehrlichia japonica]AHX04393.1 immunodominant surface domain protein [Ehrlichia japonica]
MDIDNNIDNNEVSVDTYSKTEDLLSIFVRAILGDSKNNPVVEAGDHSGTHQEGNEIISQPSSAPAASVIAEEEISKTHQGEDNLKEDLHSAVTSDNLVTLDQTVPVSVGGEKEISETHQGQNLLNMIMHAILGDSKNNPVVEAGGHSGTHQEGNEIIFQPSSAPAASVIAEEEISKTHQGEDNLKEDLHSAVTSDNLVILDQTVPVSVGGEKEISETHQGQNLLNMIMHAILDDSNNNPVVEAGDHSGTHQEGNEIIFQPSSAPAASVIAEEEISKTHQGEDNLKEDLHSAVTSDNLVILDQTVPVSVGGEKEISETHQGQNLLNMIMHAILDDSNNNPVVEAGDHSGTHQEGNETIFQPSSAPAASVIAEEEISKTHQGEDNLKEDLHSAVTSDNLVTLDQTVPVSLGGEKEISETHQGQNLLNMIMHAILDDSNNNPVVEAGDHSGTHQEGNETIFHNETIFQPSSAPAASAIAEEEISKTHQGEDNPKFLVKENLHVIINVDSMNLPANECTILPDSINKILCPVSELIDEKYVYEFQNVEDSSSLLDNSHVCCCLNLYFVGYNHFLTQENADNNAVNSII